MCYHRESEILSIRTAIKLSARIVTVTQGRGKKPPQYCLDRSLSVQWCMCMSTVDDKEARWPPAGAGEMMDEGGQHAATCEMGFKQGSSRC